VASSDRFLKPYQFETCYGFICYNKIYKIATSDKRIYCFHVEDGSRIWQFETEDKIWSSPSLAEYDGIMFFGSLDSPHHYGIDINTGRQTWKFPTMNMLDSSAAIASNMMLIGSRDGLLYIFGSEIAPSYIR
jgi:outer membrane protein assembly factor BamB